MRQKSIKWVDIQKIIETNLSKGASVSTVEYGMPLLYKFRNLSFYPLNLKSSDYILVPTSQDGLYKGYFGYNGEDAQLKTNRCLSEIIETNYDTKNVIELTPGYVILKNINLNHD